MCYDLYAILAALPKIELDSAPLDHQTTRRFSDYLSAISDVFDQSQ